MAKQLLKERFQELAGIKSLYENEDRKADHSSFEFDNYNNDGDIPLPTAGWWEDGTEMTEDELEDYYDKMELKSPGAMHSIMHDNLGEAKDHEITEEAFGGGGTDKRTAQVVGDILQLIKSTGIDPEEVIEAINLNRMNFKNSGLPKMDPDNWGFKNPKTGEYNK